MPRETANSLDGNEDARSREPKYIGAGRGTFMDYICTRYVRIVAGLKNPSRVSLKRNKFSIVLRVVELHQSTEGAMIPCVLQVSFHFLAAVRHVHSSW